MIANGNIKILKCIALGWMLLNTQLSHAQLDTAFVKRDLKFREYLSEVGKNNLSYAAQKFNVNIADAGIEMARIFPDVSLTLGGFNNGQQRLQTGYGFFLGANRTIELGGKRRARINLATSQLELSKAIVNDFFRNLRADAALSFIDALLQRQILQVKLDSYKSMNQLAGADQKRFDFGSIMKIDVTQAKVEAGTILNEVIQSAVDYKNTLHQLSIFVGKKSSDSLFSPLGNVRDLDRSLELKPLLDSALQNRADLMAATQAKKVTNDNLQLTKANRVMDLNIGLANGSISKITNIQEPTPSYNNLSFNVGIPLKFSNRYTGDIKTAEYQIHQSDLLYKNIELQIQIEVTKAHGQYLAAAQQVRQFDLGLLQEAKQVLDGKVYSYKRGQSSLLEVLNAQRTYNEVRLAYTFAIHNYAAALVNLERAAGIWDIDF